MPPGLIGGEIDAVYESEDDELQACAMPHAGQEHGEQGGGGDHAEEAAGCTERLAGDLAAGGETAALDM